MGGVVWGDGRNRGRGRGERGPLDGEVDEEEIGKAGVVVDLETDCAEELDLHEGQRALGVETTQLDQLLRGPEMRGEERVRRNKPKKITTFIA